jgi:glutaredoxin
MMKNYHLYVFTQKSCPPCVRLKDYVKTLTTDEQAEIDYVPFKTASGERTVMASNYGIEKSPTLLVVSIEQACELDDNGDEICHVIESPVERYVGASHIIENLDSLIDAYTYAHPD